MKRWSWCILILMLMIACKRHKKEMNFAEISYYDAQGNSTGSYGDISKEYHPENWDKWQYTLFVNSDTVTRDTTALATLTDAKLYPNPLTDTARFSFIIDKPALFRAVIIDKNKKVYWKVVQNIKPGYNAFTIDFIQSGIATGFYRIYYSLSAIGYSHYYRAHAGIQKL